MALSGRLRGLDLIAHREAGITVQDHARLPGQLAIAVSARHDQHEVVRQAASKHRTDNDHRTIARLLATHLCDERR
jgi:hypothetical protein